MDIRKDIKYLVDTGSARRFVIERLGEPKSELFPMAVSEPVPPDLANAEINQMLQDGELAASPSGFLVVTEFMPHTAQRFREATFEFVQDGQAIECLKCGAVTPFQKGQQDYRCDGCGHLHDQRIRSS